MGLTFKLTLCFVALTMLYSCETVVCTIQHQQPQINRINGTNMATVNGVLGKKFYKKLLDFYEENPDIKTLVLQNIPGSMNDEWNVKSCRFIHENCIHTAVTDSSMIASGGVDLFISGNNRSVAPGAQIGVHSWRDLRKDGAQYPRDSEEHDLFIEFFKDIELDTSFYWFTLRAAPGDSIHWMTMEEIEQYKLINTIDSLNRCY